MEKIVKRQPLASDIEAMSKTYHGAWQNYQEIQHHEERFVISRRWPILAETADIRKRLKDKRQKNLINSQINVE